MIRISKNIVITDNELNEEFFHASGPGGQNVNKVATAVRLRFNIRDTSSLPPDLKQRLINAIGSSITTAGELIIEAQRYRTQMKNREDAAQRLQAIITKYLIPPKKRRKTKPTKGSVKRRLDSKKQRGSLKKLRSSSHDD
ncbi:MAG: aminoacyl-tRNA hydrolase [Victivallaceae bacterium]|nr:aminoacyl-tRNA hydrolase [Victivallaceae bacterium]